MKKREKRILRIDHLPSLTSQYQDISFLRVSTAKKSRSRWMTKMVKYESGFNATGLNQSSTVSDTVLSFIYEGQFSAH